MFAQSLVWLLLEKNIKAVGSWGATSRTVWEISFTCVCPGVGLMTWALGPAYGTANMNTRDDGWYVLRGDGAPLGITDLGRYNGTGRTTVFLAGAGGSSRIRPRRSVISCLN